MEGQLYPYYSGSPSHPMEDDGTSMNEQRMVNWRNNSSSTYYHRATGSRGRGFTDTVWKALTYRTSQTPYQQVLLVPT